MGELVFLVYVIGFFISWMFLTRMVATEDQPVEDVSPGEWGEAVALGFCGAWFWPLAVPGWVVYKIAKGWG